MNDCGVLLVRDGAVAFQAFWPVVELLLLVEAIGPVDPDVLPRRGRRVSRQRVGRRDQSTGSAGGTDDSPVAEASVVAPVLEGRCTSAHTDRACDASRNASIGNLLGDVIQTSRCVARDGTDGGTGVS